MLRRIALVAFTAATLGATFSAANARPAGCAPWVCGENGTQMTGIALPELAGFDTIRIAAVTLPAASVGPALLLLAEANQPRRIQRGSSILTAGQSAANAIVQNVR